MTVVLGFDPGKSAGWAFVSDTKGLLECGAFTSDPYSTEVFSHPVYAPDQVIFEEPQFYDGKSKKADPEDLIGLVIQIGRHWQHYGEHYNAKMRIVKPADWKGQLPKNIGNARINMLLNPTEQLILSRCGKGLKAKPLTDMIDAVGLALYLVGRRLKP